MVHDSEWSQIQFALAVPNVPVNGRFPLMSFPLPFGDEVKNEWSFTSTPLYKVDL
jgi:hypothetical protein